MEEVKTPTSINDDEISLVDLFSVLFKHRFLIIGGTLAVFLVVFIYLLISIVLPLGFSK